MSTVIHTWKTIPEVIIGVIPSSIKVPRFEAIIILIQYRGSELSDETMPYRGIWLITKKIRRVSPVHVSFCFVACQVSHISQNPPSQANAGQSGWNLQRTCWKGVFVSGEATSGSRGVKGLMRSRNRTVPECVSFQEVENATTAGNIRPLMMTSLDRTN